jgi:hypothetical protein
LITLNYNTPKSPWVDEAGKLVSFVHFLSEAWAVVHVGGLRAAMPR